MVRVRKRLLANLISQRVKTPHIILFPFPGLLSQFHPAIQNSVALLRRGVCFSLSSVRVVSTPTAPQPSPPQLLPASAIDLVVLFIRLVGKQAARFCTTHKSPAPKTRTRPLRTTSSSHLGAARGIFHRPRKAILSHPCLAQFPNQLRRGELSPWRSSCLKTDAIPMRQT
ncbi:hypothetical protein GUJ93_ZPchr0006g44993 [Zizania palustris]|uniref:Uncharacterized protein n=1 Tax=Zizania palustris TaxID=103762 RepID=A0A8J5SB88_ZIZPA|nr:hypothetical protein GUJ93_ZPchr0006g44993 [Zizania palustris]